MPTVLSQGSALNRLSACYAFESFCFKRSYLCTGLTGETFLNKTVVKTFASMKKTASIIHEGNCLYLSS